MDELRFDGRVAVVTGAGRGVGRAHALLLAARGAAVVVNDLGVDGDGRRPSEGPAQEVVGEIRAGGGTAVASVESVTSAEGAASIIRAATDTFGRLDILVNNAGNIIMKPFEEHTPADFQALIDVHLIGAVNMIMAAWPTMTAAGYGRVINTTSNAIFGMRQLAAYGAAKAAVHGLTLGLAREGRRSGILVNCIAPAAESRMLWDNREAFGERMAEEVSTMRPEQVSPMLVYLAHDSCEATGEVFYSGGGEIYRMVLLRTVGFRDAELTPEEVASRFAEVRDVGNVMIQ